MPRPKRPTPSPLLLSIAEDEWLTEVTGLERSELPRLKRATERAFADYLAGWTPGARPGRRSEDRRNELIVTLARVFQRHCGWDAAYRQHYLDYLIEFLRLELTAHGVRVPWSRLRRMIPPALRVPR